MDIVLFGSGNVAHHLGSALHRQGHRIVQVYNRTLHKAQELAKLLASTAIAEPEQLELDADLYVLAVSDQAIPLIIDWLPSTLPGMIIHTSGAVDVSALAKFKRSGVIYPPQSLTKGVATNLSKVPFGIEASDTDTLGILMELMRPISPHTFPCTSQQRIALHAAGVFANNFPNALFQIAHDILQREDLSFDLIRPLILETAQKVQDHLPNEVQTGPAIRNDQTTIAKHVDYLNREQDWQSIYQLISSYISKKDEL